MIIKQILVLGGRKGKERKGKGREGKGKGKGKGKERKGKERKGKDGRREGGRKEGTRDPPAFDKIISIFTFLIKSYISYMYFPFTLTLT